MAFYLRKERNIPLARSNSYEEITRLAQLHRKSGMIVNITGWSDDDPLMQKHFSREVPEEVLVEYPFDDCIPGLLCSSAKTECTECGSWNTGYDVSFELAQCNDCGYQWLEVPRGCVE